MNSLASGWKFLMSVWVCMVLVACKSSPAPSTPTAATGSAATPASSSTALASTPSASPSVATLTTPPAVLTLTPIVGATAVPTTSSPSDTVKRTDGQNLVLSNPRFYWTLKLPGEWVVTNDTGFELQASSPQKTAFVHLLSQTWKPGNRLPNAQAYVNYWQHTVYGNVFPPYADGTQLAQTEVSPEKFGGPYLRYEFDDNKKGMHYLQVYASGGGPSSLVVTTWARSADFDGLKGTLDAIITSAALLQE
jgi:hypothetical protein